VNLFLIQLLFLPLEKNFNDEHFFRVDLSIYLIFFNELEKNKTSIYFIFHNGYKPHKPFMKILTFQVK